MHGHVLTSFYKLLYDTWINKVIIIIIIIIVVVVVVVIIIIINLCTVNKSRIQKTSVHYYIAFKLLQPQERATEDQRDCGRTEQEARLPISLLGSKGSP